jgi:uncharacterized 2Fe-2S/4Fe-4S cluster protein (DUF4445 family)
MHSCSASCPTVRLTPFARLGTPPARGAVRALLSAAARVEMETVVAKVTKIETALEPAFQQHFVDAMGFPHTVTPTPHLAQAVTLPPPSNAGDDSTRRRSRRTTSTENP